MKLLRVAFLLAALPLVAPGRASAADAKRAANTVVLDETGVRNLRIETVEVEEADFEEITFALGRIEPIPNRVGAVSSRIPGRVLEMKVIPGDPVVAGQEVARIESRQPGDPPPVITLKTPLAGMVTKLDARLGDPVEPDRALLEIADLREVYAVARVPEHLAGRMKTGTLAHIKVSALPDEKLEGELLNFGTTADRNNGTIDAIFRVTNPGGRLRPAMRAEFLVVLSRRAGVTSVPRAALQGDAANRFVYVADFDLKNAFIRTPVTVGETNLRFAEITGGLLPGDTVVTSGAYSLGFVGGGAISLKEALDAAHGHEHAADGSELTPEARAKAAAASKAGDAHEHDHGDAAGGGAFWKVVSGVLLVSVLWNRKRPGERPPSDGRSTPAEKSPRSEALVHPTEVQP